MTYADHAFTHGEGRVTGITPGLTFPPLHPRRRQQGNRFICKGCDRIFRWPEDLIAHVERHRANCDEC